MSQISYGDSYSLAQLAGHWVRSTFFVQQMIQRGKLQVDERGLVTNTAPKALLRGHGGELD